MIPVMNAAEQEAESERLKLIIDSIPSLIHTARPDGYLDYFNKSWLKYLGCSLEDVEGWKWTAFIHAEEVEGMVARWRACVRSGENFAYEARVRRSDGDYRWMLYRKSPQRDGAGKIVRWYGSSLDVEDLKLSEQKAQNSERDLQLAIDTFPVALFTARADGSTDFCNRRWLEYTGLSQEESRRWSETGVVHPDDLPRAIEAWKRALSTRTPINMETRHRRADGQYRWFWGSLVPLLDERGNITKWFGASFDIEDRKRAEDALRRSERLLAEAQRLTRVGSWEYHPDGSALRWSAMLYEIFGLDPAKEPPNFEESLLLVHPDDREVIGQSAAHRLAEGEIFDHRFRMIRPDGKTRVIREVGTPVYENGIVTRYFGACIDITEDERKTEALRRSEAYLAEAQRLSQTGSFGWNPRTGEIFWSEETFRIFEYDHTAAPTIELVLQRVHPEDAALVKQAIERASLDRKDFDFEHRLLMPDGSVKHLHVAAHALRDESASIEFAGAITDVTSAKQAGDRIRRIINTVPGLVWSARADGEVDFFNQRLLDYMGMTMEQVRGLGWEPAVHPDDGPQVLSKWRAALAEKKLFETEIRLRRFDGEYRWFLSRGTPLLDSTGRVLAWYGNSIDIHDKKQAEEKLLQSEQQWRDVFENNPTMYFMVDAAGTVIAVNPFGAEQLGYEVNELLGQSVLKVFYSPDADLAQTNVSNCLQQLGRSMTWELRKMRKDGSVLWVRETARAVLRAGQPVVLIACEDITERRIAEDKIREQETELRQILDLAPQHVGVLGPDGSRLYANHITLEYFGVNMDQWRADGARFDLIHPDDRGHFLDEREKRFREGAPHEFEARLLKHDGSFRWFLFRLNPLKDPQGYTTRWYSVASDIEDRKQAEERLRHENVALREELDKSSMFEEIVGCSPALQTVLSRVSKVAPTDSSVLITGETGTGKELVARAIHKRSQRSSSSFISVNCAAIPKDLIASELFGHEKGAFTGATQRHLGRFELAEGGTIFLDEIGELSTETQIVLLRVLQEHEFERVGGAKSIRTNVRVIAATNQELQAAISSGAFRKDLFYRLNVFPIHVPALRERKQDIPLLVEYFIDRFARKSGKSIREVTKKTLELLKSYSWPGNIRELQNVVERSVILCDTGSLSVDENWLSTETQGAEPNSAEALSEKLAAQERLLIEAALRECSGRVYGPEGAAAKLGMPRSTLEYKIRSLRINKNLFKTDF